MSESFAILSPFTMIVAVVLIGAAAGIVKSLAEHVRKFAEHHQELEFKREMIERGLTIDEIERLVHLNRHVDS